MYKKSFRIFLLLLLYNFITFSNSLEFGISSGYTIAQKKFGVFWDNSVNGGITFGYPLFHPDLPCHLSLTVSHHKPAGKKPDKKGYLPATKNVILLNTQLSIQYSLLKHLPTSPNISFGLTNNTFISYSSWPPEGNDGETEIGLCGGVGLLQRIGKRIVVNLSYQQNIVFTEPHFVLFGNVILSIKTPLHFSFLERKHEK